MMAPLNRLRQARCASTAPRSRSGPARVDVNAVEVVPEDQFRHLAPERCQRSVIRTQRADARMPGFLEMTFQQVEAVQAGKGRRHPRPQWDFRPTSISPFPIQCLTLRTKTL